MPSPDLPDSKFPGLCRRFREISGKFAKRCSDLDRPPLHSKRNARIALSGRIGQPAIRKWRRIVPVPRETIAFILGDSFGIDSTVGGERFRIQSNPDKTITGDISGNNDERVSELTEHLVKCVLQGECYGYFFDRRDGWDCCRKLVVQIDHD